MICSRTPASLVLPPPAPGPLHLLISPSGCLGPPSVTYGHQLSWKLSSGVASPRNLPRTTSRSSQGPLEAPVAPWASFSSAFSAVHCDCLASVQTPHFTDVKTEAQKGEVPCPRRSRAGTQPRAVSASPTPAVLAASFLSSRAYGVRARSRAGRRRGGGVPMLPLCAGPFGDRSWEAPSSDGPARLDTSAPTFGPGT